MDQQEWISLSKEHLPLVVGAASTLFVAIRILSVANFDPQTGYGLLQAGGTAPVILGAILYSANIFLVITFMLSIVILARLIGARRSTQKRIVAFIALASGVAALFIAPISFFGVLLLVAIYIYGRPAFLYWKEPWLFADVNNPPSGSGEVQKAEQEVEKKDVWNPFKKRLG